MELNKVLTNTAIEGTKVACDNGGAQECVAKVTALRGADGLGAAIARPRLGCSATTPD